MFNYPCHVAHLHAGAQHLCIRHSICIYAIAWRIYLPYENVITVDIQRFTFYQIIVCVAHIQLVNFYLFQIFIFPIYPTDF